MGKHERTDIRTRWATTNEPWTPMQRVLVAVAWAVGAALLVIGVSIAVVGVLHASRSDRALDSGSSDTVSVVLEGDEPARARNGWDWRAYPATGGAKIDEFEVSRTHDSDLIDLQGRVVQVELVDGQVAAVHVPGGATIRTTDVGLRGAMVGLLIGGTVVGATLWGLGWLLSRIRSGLGFAWSVLGAVILFLSCLSYLPVVLF